MFVMGGILTDAKYIVDAIDQAIYGVMENPDYGGQVGCVIVGPNGDVLCRSYNKKVNGKRLHAEEIALNEVGDMDISGSTMYLTIEPCNGNVHHDRKHCCEQIVNAGVGRVVMANRKFRYEGGADYIRKSDIPVDTIENDKINQLCGLLAKSVKDGSFSKKTLNKIASARSNITLFSEQHYPA